MKNSQHIRKLCKGLNKKGQQCQMYPLTGEEFCMVHSQSERAEDIRLRNREIIKGINRLTPLGRLRILHKNLKEIVEGITLGEISRKEGMPLILQYCDAMDKLEEKIKEARENRTIF